MPSQPLDTGWNFSPVYDLIDLDAYDVGSPISRSELRSPTSSAPGGVGLGNFWKLYESLGMTPDLVAQPLPPLDESELSTSDDALSPSPVLGAISAPRTDETQSQCIDLDRIQTQPIAIEAPVLQPDLEAIQTLANDGGTNKAVPSTTKKQRRKARRQAEKAILEQSLPDDLPVSKASVIAQDDVNMIPRTPTKPSRAQSNVGAKLRSATPVSAQVQLPPTASASRPTLQKRPKSIDTTTMPQLQTPIQSIPNTLVTPQHSTYGPPVPFQQFMPPQTSAHLKPLAANVPMGSGLVPRNVRPVTVPRQSHTTAIVVAAAAARSRLPVSPSPVPLPNGFGNPQNRPSIIIRQQTDRHFHLFEKLLVRFAEERKWLIAPRQLVNENTRVEGIHVFVDASNIMIGFRDMLRYNGVQPFDMSFDSLALLMERRRPVAKRVFVGSHREASPLPYIQRLVETSKAVGYECNVQEQVHIVREDSKKKKFFKDVERLGWQKAMKRSGSGSDSETGLAPSKTPPAPKWVEQGVDELLHLKMCQSLLDTELPSTMVLATGDGAEAEMSDGFLAHVERALRKGWKVELITWRQQMNAGYKRPAFRRKWGEQFTVIELDDFLEDLIDTP